MIDSEKLSVAISDKKLNIVLLLNGCFNPIHNNHIRLLELAREHLNASNTHHVIGGYISPTHDVAIRRKLPVLHATWQDRLAMCRLAVQDSSWIMIDAWQIAQEKVQGAQQAKKHLENFLRKIHPSIQVVSICGGDALPKLRSAFKKELVICVLNRPVNEFDFYPWLQSSSIQSYRNNILLIDDQNGVKHLSSTFIRERLSQEQYDCLSDDLHPSVLDYHRQHGIIYRAKEIIPWSDLQDKNSIVELGHGRCATIYSKQYKNEQIAVKVVRERKQFEHESKILILLINDASYHINIVRILGLGEQFCLMEQCDIDLLSYIKQIRISSRQTLRAIFPDRHWLHWIEQMSAGFAHLVSLGILHRDIKTDNILLANSIIKIADFSVSAQANQKNKMPLRGSIRHYAPEAILHKTIYTHAADVYMFGCVLYEIVHGGQRVWEGKETSEVVERRLNNERPLFNVQCEPWYIDLVVDDCWAMNSHARSSFEQILARVRSLTNE